MCHAEARFEYRIQAEAERQQPERQGGGPLGNMQDRQRPQHHARQPRAQDDQREAAFEMRFLQMPEGGAESERHAGDLVRGQRHPERQPQKDENGKLDQTGPAAGQRREKIGRQ